MSGQSGVNGHGGSFFVSYFSDHYYIRVLPQNGSESAGKIIPYFRLDLRLIHSFNVVFYRVFQANDIVDFPVQFFKHGVKGGRLARPGRSGKKNKSVWPGYHFSDNLQMVRRQAQFFQSFDTSLSVQNSYHHFFPEKRRKGGDAEVYVPAFYAGFKPAVLRFSFFVNLHIGQDFYSGNYRFVDSQGQNNARVHNAVHPKSYFHPVGNGFYVDIGSVAFKSVP